MSTHVSVCSCVCAWLCVHMCAHVTVCTCYVCAWGPAVTTATAQPGAHRPEPPLQKSSLRTTDISPWLQSTSLQSNTKPSVCLTASKQVLRTYLSELGSDKPNFSRRNKHGLWTVHRANSLEKSQCLLRVFVFYLVWVIGKALAEMAPWAGALLLPHIAAHPEGHTPVLCTQLCCTTLSCFHLCHGIMNCEGGIWLSLFVSHIFSLFINLFGIHKPMRNKGWKGQSVPLPARSVLPPRDTAAHTCALAPLKIWNPPFQKQNSHQVRKLPDSICC